jgi:hypothetical protein
MGAPTLTNGVNGHQADIDVDSLYAWVAPQTPLAALPEARASVNVRVTICGRECQLTLRDHDEARLLERLTAVLQQFPVAPTPQPQDRGKEWCKIHNVAMQRHENAKGVWYSHYIDGKHCKGR